MPTQCSFSGLDFQSPGRRQVRACFDGGRLTSEGGAILLGELERRLGLLKRFAGCFRDFRAASRIEHSVEELVKQRVFGLVLGYEDLIDHDLLRRDPVLALIAGKEDPLGSHRRVERDRGSALAGRSTLNRLEGARAGEADRYHRVSYEAEQMDELFVEIFLDSYQEAPSQIVLDLDATDDPIHGSQEGRFFHGYYRSYCYLPLYIFCSDHLLCARLRVASQDASVGVEVELERIVGQIRTRWPEVEVIVRGDSGFAREALMSWCEDHRVDFVFGLAKNARLLEMIDEKAERVRRKALRRGKAVRQYKQLRYRTLDSWSKKRRVVAKVEHLPKGANPRFVVTSLKKEAFACRALYEDRSSPKVGVNVKEVTPRSGRRSFRNRVGQGTSWSAACGAARVRVR